MPGTLLQHHNFLQSAALPALRPQLEAAPTIPYQETPCN